jgi:hypothetical protein
MVYLGVTVMMTAMQGQNYGPDNDDDDDDDYDDGKKRNERIKEGHQIELGNVKDYCKSKDKLEVKLSLCLTN